MADDAAIRRQNFRRLYPLNDKGEFPGAKAARELGSTPSYWSELAKGTKSFGEKKAREIEEKLSLVRLSLDDPQGARPMPISSDILQHIESLSPEDQAKVDAVLRAHLGLPAGGTLGKRAGNP